MSTTPGGPGSPRVDLLFTYRVKDGGEERFEEYLRLVPPLTESQEPYVLEYEIFRRADGSILQHERYEDEAAIAKHLEVTAEGQAAWGEAIEDLQLWVIGDLSDAWWEQHGGPHATRFERFRAIDR